MYLSFDQEKALCRALLLRSGMSETDAGILSSANYLKRFANGAMKPDAPVTVAADNGSTVVFDCHNGCGVVDVVHAYEFLRERVADCGIVIGTAKRSSNIGCGSFYAQMAARDNLIALICCNTVRCWAPTPYSSRCRRWRSGR